MSKLGQPDQGIQQQRDSTAYESCLQCCGNFTGCLRIYLPCICCCCSSPIYELQTARVGILQSFGRFKRVIEPGLHVINPVTQSVIAVDLKTVVMSLAPQVVITKDNVSLKIQTTVYYRTINPYKLVYKLGNNLNQIRAFIGEMSYSAMRTIVGQHILQELLQDRATIAQDIQKYVKNSVGIWGLFIQNIFIKDLILSEQTKKNLQSAAIQKRVSQAQIISAEADVQAAKLLKQTSDILNSQSAMQIRYLQAVQSIISSGNQKTLFVSLKGKQ